MNNLLDLIQEIFILIYKNFSTLLLFMGAFLFLRYVSLVYSFDVMTLWLSGMLFLASMSLEATKRKKK